MRFLLPLDVLLGKLAVFVQQLAETQLHDLTGLGHQGEGQVARNILSKVQHSLAGGCGNPLCFQPLTLRDGDIVGGAGG